MPWKKGLIPNFRAMALGSSTVSPYRDRTGEFLVAAERLRKSPAFVHGASFSVPDSGSHPTIFQSPQTGVHMQSEFNRRASHIGLGIHHTSQKLAKLALLAKRKGVFDDPALEIQELTALIRQDITALNAAITELQQLCDGESESVKMTREGSQHTATALDTLKSRLMKTTKEFKDILTVRKENLKAHQNRRQLFSASSSSNGSNGFPRQRQLPPTSLPLPWENGSTSGELFNRSSGTGIADGPHLRRRFNSEASSFSGQQQSQIQQHMGPVQEGYTQSRAGALESVESTIAELGNIFTQLATMVAQQGEIAIRIDENMDDTLANVEGAQGQLLKYLRSISSSRWLIIKLFVVLLVFLLIFVFFVA